MIFGSQNSALIFAMQNWECCMEGGCLSSSVTEWEVTLFNIKINFKSQFYSWFVRNYQNGDYRPHASQTSLENLEQTVFSGYLMLLLCQSFQIYCEMSKPPLRWKKGVSGWQEAFLFGWGFFCLGFFSLFWCCFCFSFMGRVFLWFLVWLFFFFEIRAL